MLENSYQKKPCTERYVSVGWENFNKPLKAVQIISIDNDFRFMILLSRIKDLLIKDIKGHVIK